MLTNSRAEVESLPVTDHSSAPPDWYSDPEDESQYRYWDGSAWTQHRAPRHVAQQRPLLRGPGKLIGDSVRTLLSQYRGCSVVALLSVGSFVLSGVLFIYSADRFCPESSTRSSRGSPNRPSTPRHLRMRRISSRSTLTSRC